MKKERGSEGGREKYSKWTILVGKGREQETFPGTNSTAVDVIYLIICRSAWTEDLITFSVLMSGSMELWIKLSGFACICVCLANIG